MATGRNEARRGRRYRTTSEARGTQQRANGEFAQGLTANKPAGAMKTRADERTRV